MRPKQKALDLCIKMGYIEGELMAVNYIAKRHALIAVDEILQTQGKKLFWRAVRECIEDL